MTAFVLCTLYHTVQGFQRFNYNVTILLVKCRDCQRHL